MEISQCSQHQAWNATLELIPLTSFLLSTAGASVEKLGEAAACAVKRTNLDYRMIQAAQGAGATLKEHFEVSGDRVSFDREAGLWTVTSASVSPDCCRTLARLSGEHQRRCRWCLTRSRHAMSATQRPGHVRGHAAGFDSRDWVPGAWS